MTTALRIRPCRARAPAAAAPVACSALGPDRAAARASTRPTALAGRRPAAARWPRCSTSWPRRSRRRRCWPGRCSGARRATRPSELLPELVAGRSASSTPRRAEQPEPGSAVARARSWSAATARWPSGSVLGLVAGRRGRGVHRARPARCGRRPRHRPTSTPTAARRAAAAIRDAVRRVRPGRRRAPARAAAACPTWWCWPTRWPRSRPGSRGCTPAACAHLPVRMRDGIGVVGPLVLPGRTACLRCLELQRCGRDPGWPTRRGAARRAAGRADPAATAATAALGVAQALAALDSTCSGGARPPTCEATLELDATAGRRSPGLGPDPACGAGGRRSRGRCPVGCTTTARRARTRRRRENHGVNGERRPGGAQASTRRIGEERRDRHPAAHRGTDGQARQPAARSGRPGRGRLGTPAGRRQRRRDLRRS